MKSKILQAVGVTLLLGAAALSLAPTGTCISSAQAATVRPAVGNPLQAAIALANAGKLTASEQAAISQTKNFIAAKTGAGGSALGCKAKFANDYNAGRYRDVVGADAACLRKRSEER